MMQVAVRKAFKKPRISSVYSASEKGLRQDTFYADPFTILMKARVVPTGFVLNAVDTATNLVTRYAEDTFKKVLEKWREDAKRPLALRDREETRRPYDRAPQPYGSQRSFSSYVPSTSAASGWQDRRDRGWQDRPEGGWERGWHGWR